MTLSELTAYAEEKYQLQEQHKWADFPGFSVLADPESGKWIALLMRQWDGERGEEIERCDLKCGQEMLRMYRRPYLTVPLRMKGAKWIGITMDRGTEEDVVFRLFDRAVEAGKENGYTVVLASELPAKGSAYTDTALPPRGSVQQGRPRQGELRRGGASYTGVAVERAGTSYDYAGNVRQDAARPKEAVPERLRTLKHMFRYSRESTDAKARNFYRMAVYMKDYVDELPWSGDFTCYFPTYQDLTTHQLQGYFHWRAHARKGEFLPIPTSASYIYVYELLNGVGASSPEDCLRKLADFRRGFLDSGLGDEHMRPNLDRWMLEYGVAYGLPAETIKMYAGPEQLERDERISVLRDPAAHTDEEIFAALLYFGGGKTAESPVLMQDPKRGKRLFAAAWRAASAYVKDGSRLFRLCFGERKTRQWYPLSNAVVCMLRGLTADKTVILNDCRAFRCKNGIWQTSGYEKLYFNKDLLKGFLHETDAKLRRYLKTGRYLKEKEADRWADLYLTAVIEEEKQAILEASRPKIEIDLSELDTIRRNAAITRESLLTEEERGEEAFSEKAEQEYLAAEAAVSAAANAGPGEIIAAGTAAAAGDGDVPEETGQDFVPADGQSDFVPAEETGTGAAETAGAGTADLPLDALQVRVLRTLLQGGDPAAILKENHLMPSITADFINEALFDEIGDSVLLAEGDRLTLVEDYIEDLELLLGGIVHG